MFSNEKKKKYQGSTKIDTTALFKTKSNSVDQNMNQVEKNQYLFAILGTLNLKVDSEHIVVVTMTKSTLHNKFFIFFWNPIYPIYYLKKINK